MGRLGEEAVGRPSEYLLDAEGNAAGAAAYDGNLPALLFPLGILHLRNIAVLFP